MIIRDDTCVSTIEAREQKGDLYVLFNVEFPKRLPPDPKIRQELISALAPVEQ